MPLPLIPLATTLFRAVRVAGGAKNLIEIERGVKAAGIKPPVVDAKFMARNKRATKYAPLHKAEQAMSAKIAKEADKVASIPNAPQALVNSKVNQIKTAVNAPVRKMERARSAVEAAKDIAKSSSSRKAFSEEKMLQALEVFEDQTSVANIMGRVVGQVSGSSALANVVKRELIKEGLGPEIRAVNSKVMATVRKQKYELSSGRIYKGVDNITMGDNALTNFNYELYVRRVADAEASGIRGASSKIAREMLSEDLTLTFRDGSKLSGPEALRAAERVTAYNRKLERAQVKGFTYTKGGEKVKVDPKDVREMSKRRQTYAIESRKATNAESLNRIASQNPLTKMVSMHDQAKANFNKSLSVQRVPDRLREIIMTRVSRMSMTEFADRILNTPGSNGYKIMFSSHGDALAATIREICNGMDVDLTDPETSQLVDEMMYGTTVSYTD